MSFAVRVYAVDGVIEINADSAAVGEVTASDQPGYPVTLDVPGSYILTGNLTVPDVDSTAIEVIAADVTIDLNGFAILGPNDCPGSPCLEGQGQGIHSTHANTVVHNGTVRGMGGSGVSLEGATSRVERVRAIANGHDGIATKSGLVVSCTVTDNSGSGLRLGRDVGYTLNFAAGNANGQIVGGSELRPRSNMIVRRGGRRHDEGRDDAD